MIALGIGAEPARVLAQGVPVRQLAAALAIALGVVPALSLVVCRSYDLHSAELVGLVLMGISPGAPMALRKSRQSGGDGDFSLVLQIAVAVLAIATVPIWILIIRLLYGHPAGLSVLVLAKQIFLAQLLPLALGFLINLLLPTLAKRLIRPLLWLSGLLMLAIVILLIATFWRQFASLSAWVLAASATLTMGALLLAHLFCGPSPAIRVSSGMIVLPPQPRHRAADRIGQRAPLRRPGDDHRARPPHGGPARRLPRAPPPDRAIASSARTSVNFALQLRLMTD